jgi:hypothetical protein
MSDRFLAALTNIPMWLCHKIETIFIVRSSIF